MKRAHRSQYLVNESPIPLYPSLAVALKGSDPALILQQLNYWLTRSDNYRDGRYWVYNTYAEWHEQFPWISVSTIRRVLVSLEEQGLVVTANHNRQKTDRTKWYTIDDEAIGVLLASVNLEVPTAQNEQSVVHPEQIDPPKLDRSVPETTPETTQRESGAVAPRVRTVDELRAVLRDGPRIGRR